MKLKSVILLYLLLVLPTISFADIYVTISAVNARKGPGKKYSLSFTLDKGDKVELLIKKNRWYKINHFGKVGYVHSKYLSLEKEIEITPQPNILPQLKSFLIIPIIILLIYYSFVIYRKLRDKRLLESVTNRRRGTKSERDLVLQLIKYGIPAEDIFHDLYLEKAKGQFSQIDLVALTNVGVIVFEVKDYSGWIFGYGHQPQWTKSYGKQKYYFYNPIKQNQSHISELKKKFILNQFVPIFSVVVFYGTCQLKSINYVPSDTFIIKSNRVVDAITKIIIDHHDVSFLNLDEIKIILRESVINGSLIENQIQHNENIENMLGTNRILN